MKSATKFDLDTEASPDLKALMNGVAALRRDLAALLRVKMSDVSETVAWARNAVGLLGSKLLSR